MLLAELHGKLSRGLLHRESAKSNPNHEESEDILTSNVFGFLKYADRKTYLKQFLQRVELKLGNEDLSQVEFQFWPTYPDGTEPDVVLISDQYYILIEAKKNAGFGSGEDDMSHQLAREYREGKKAASSLGKEFILLTITADACFKQQKFKQVPFLLTEPCFFWTNWQNVSTILQVVLEQESCVPDRLFAEDLLALLERKNLRGFNSFDRLSFPYRSAEKIFFEYTTAVYRGGFVGFKNVLPAYRLAAIDQELFFMQEES